MQRTGNGLNTSKTDGMFDRYKNVLDNLPEYSKNIFRKDYFKWLFQQVKGWHRISYVLLAVNFMLQTYLMISTLMGNPNERLMWGAIFGFIGGNLSVLCVTGIANKSGIQGWAGLTSALAIIASAAISHNWANIVEQTIYIVALDLFCILDPKWNDNIVAERFKSAFDWVKYLVFFAIMWGIIYWVFSMTSDPNLFWDSLTLAIAFTASLLELNRKSEQWIFWLFGNLTSIILWFSSFTQGTASMALAVSYTIFFLNSLSGARWWFFGDKK